MGVDFNVFPLHPATLLRGYPQRPSLGIVPFNLLRAVVLRIGVPATATIFACAIDGPRSWPHTRPVNELYHFPFIYLRYMLAKGDVRSSAQAKRLI